MNLFSADLFDSIGFPIFIQILPREQETATSDLALISLSPKLTHGLLKHCNAFDMNSPDRAAAETPEKVAVSTVQQTGPSSYTCGTPEEKRLVKKIDWHLLPAIWLLYLIAVRKHKQCIVPSNIKSARLTAAPEHNSIWTEPTSVTPGWRA